MIIHSDMEVTLICTMNTNVLTAHISQPLTEQVK